MLKPTQSPVPRLLNLLLYLRQAHDPRVLRWLQALLGDHFRLYGGKAFCTFYEVQALLAADYEPLDWFCAPMDDRADYLTKSYAPFLLSGPNQRLRRAHVRARWQAMLAQLEDLEALLAAAGDPERALARFAFRHLGRVEISDADIAALADYREWGSLLMLLPKWLRTTIFRVQDERLRAWRTDILSRMEAAGEPLADSLFDTIWFQSAPITAYANEALAILRARPELLPQVLAESREPPASRPKTVALVNEAIRLHTRVATKLFFHEDEVKVAVIANAARDEIRYAHPHEVDLDRDQSDAIATVDEEFLPVLAAAVVAHQLSTSLDKRALRVAPASAAAPAPAWRRGVAALARRNHDHKPRHPGGIQ